MLRLGGGSDGAAPRAGLPALVAALALAAAASCAAPTLAGAAASFLPVPATASTSNVAVAEAAPASPAGDKGTRPPGVADADEVSAQKSDTAPAPVLKVATPAAVTVGSSPLWEQELRRNAAIQAKLRLEAGDRVFFSAGSAELGSRARAALAAQAQWLIRWHEFEAAIEGHADERGTESDNVNLSQRRAEAVRQRLVDEGVEARRLAIVAQGRSQRVATCPDPECLVQNRRAVTLVFTSGTAERLGLAALPVPQALDQRRPPGPATVHSPAATEIVGVPR